MNAWWRLLRFNAVGACGVGVQIATLWLLADVAHVQYLIATSAAVGLTVVHNFIWHWLWTWNDRTGAGGFVTTLARFAAANGALSLVGNLGVTATLVSGTHLGPVVANGIAIGVCGLLNFWLGDAVVFRESRLT